MLNQGDVLDFFTLFKDYIDTLKNNKIEEKNLKVLDIQEFLGVESLDETFCYDDCYDEEFQYIDVAHHLNQFLLKNFTLKKKSAYNYSYEKREQSTYKKIKETHDATNFVKVPYHNFMFLKGEEFNLVAEFNFGRHDVESRGIILHVAAKDEDNLNKLLKDYETFYAEQNIYKNKKVSFRSYEAFKLLPPSTRQFDTVVLQDGYLDEIKQNIISIFEEHENYKSNNLPLKRGVLLSGSPGTGKTSLVEAICSYFDKKVTIFIVTSVSVSRTICIENIYKTARKLSPSLVIFEDIDLLGGDRDQGEYSSLVGELLNQLDGAESNEMVVTLATTNHPDRLDKAISNRPARFDRHLKFHLPDNELRLKILTQYINKHSIDINLEKSLKSLANDMKDFSGAQIQEVVISAVLNAMQRDKNNVILNKDDIEAGIRKVKEIFTTKSEFRGLT